MSSLDKKVASYIQEAIKEERVMQEVLLEESLAVGGNKELPQIKPIEAQAVTDYLLTNKDKREAALDNGLNPKVFFKPVVKRAIEKALDEAGFDLKFIANRVKKLASDNANPFVSLRALELGGKMRTDVFPPKHYVVDQRGVQVNIEVQQKAKKIVDKFLGELNEKAALNESVIDVESKEVKKIES
jgi:hypothetical protein